MKDQDIIIVDNIEYYYLAGYERLQNNDHPKKGVMCPKCNATNFTLSYGNYELIAHCQCGHSMTVYDG